MSESGTTELNPIDQRKFELFTRVGISAAALNGGYEGAKKFYESKTGRSFDKDLELARKSIEDMTTHRVSKKSRNDYMARRKYRDQNNESQSASYCGICRLRIDYAELQNRKAWSKVDWVPHEECKKRADFWIRSAEYWKAKLKLALTQRSMDKAMMICKADGEQLSRYYEDMSVDDMIASIQ